MHKWGRDEGRVRRRNTKQEAPEPAPSRQGPPLWLQLAQGEIEMRMHVGTGGRDFLDHMLQMEARLKSTYPDMPFDVRNEFGARLNATGYTEDAWNAAVAWLESTDWFKSRSRYPGRR